MKINRKVRIFVPTAYTHQGAPAAAMMPEQALRRSVMSCMLWEKEFYEDGEDIASRVARLVPALPFETIESIAVEAREKMKLRHMPLLIAREALRHFHGQKVGLMIERIVQRPDEITELLSLYWKEGKRPLAKQLKVGLSKSVQKFDEYQLAKWSGGSGPISMRDVVFLTHAKPRDKDAARLMARMVNKTFIPEAIAKELEIDPKDVGLASPETWENKLSRGEDKKKTFTVMLMERKLGGLALLRNLRGMIDAGVDHDLIVDALGRMRTDRILPFQFITAANAAPGLKNELSDVMLKVVQHLPRLPGHTILLVDVSGSMQATVSGRSQISRMDAAMGLAVLAKEMCDQVTLATFSDRALFMPEGNELRGLPLIDALRKMQRPGGTDLGGAVEAAKRREHDRLIVFTDEQSWSYVPAPLQPKSYMINVASAQNGVGYKAWRHIDGWSEATMEYIAALEQADEGAVA